MDTSNFCHYCTQSPLSKGIFSHTFEPGNLFTFTLCCDIAKRARINFIKILGNVIVTKNTYPS